MRRATTAQKYLTNGGVSSSMIKTISYGEERPVCSEASDSCWDRNRRDEFRFQ
jgi:peptidoglycan-associated lipoprotein